VSVPVSADPLAAVLAGGRSTRLGRPKATAPLGGRALIDHPLTALADSALETVVVAKRDTELPELEVPLWSEPDEPAHPLLGIVTALERAARPLLVCGCDLPFVTPPLATHIAVSAHPLVVPSAGGRLHPLFARYDPSLLEPLRAALEHRSPLQEVIAALGPRLLDEQELRSFGDPARLLFNVNTPADLELAERMLGER
jgi:molybdopterin-guanine dinucleotide biosynthesis protein A